MRAALRFPQGVGKSGYLCYLAPMTASGPPSDALLAALYDGIVDAGGLERALGLLAEQFHCPSAALISFDAAAPEADVVSSAGMFAEPALQRAYNEEWAPLDPAPRAFAALSFGTAASTGMLFDAEYLRSCAFFQEFFRPRGFEECLGANLSSRNGHFALLGLQRGADRRAFKRSEIQTLEEITPHLGRALQLRRTFVRLGVKVDSLVQMIDRLAGGIIVLGSEGGEIHVNRAAREIAARNDGLWLDRNGALHAAERGAERVLVRICADVRAGGAGGIVCVPRREEARPYAVLAAPLPAGAAIAGTDRGAPSLLIVIHDPDARIAAAPESIAAIFSLPDATARLIAALAEGVEAKSYAEQQGITMDAVKFHLKTAFAKTGLRSQARLLQAVARALADLSARRRGDE
jgi:GAF domain-containing protein/DNA-binding CsgD family transcriptional regulator